MDTRVLAQVIPEALHRLTIQGLILILKLNLQLNLLQLLPSAITALPTMQPKLRQAKLFLLQE